MSNLKEIYSEVTYETQNLINNLLNKVEPKIEKQFRNESLSKEEEKLLIEELKNINATIIDNGGSKIIFTDPNNLIKSAKEFEKCVNWFKYMNKNILEEERE